MFRKFIILSLILFVFPCYASDRILYENFDDQEVTVPLTAVDGDTTPLVEGDDYTWATGYGGTGYAIFFRLTDNRDSVIWWGYDYPVTDPWPSDEMYFSFWMRYPDFTSTDSHENMKIFYPHWDGTSSYVHYALADDHTVYYSANGDGSVLTDANWLNCPNMTDGNWHHYEWYIKFSTGISKFWYDDVLKVDDVFGTGHWTNDIYYIAAPSIDAEEVATFSRQVDEWELWDGMPDADTTISISSGSLSVSSGSLDIH